MTLITTQLKTAIADKIQSANVANLNIDMPYRADSQAMFLIDDHWDYVVDQRAIMWNCLTCWVMTSKRNGYPATQLTIPKCSA